MPTSAILQSAASSSAGVFSRIIADCLDIEALWSIDHDPSDTCAGALPTRLLAFADPATLARLRANEHLHTPGIDLLVVVDGDAFASAWGPGRVSGSLARWAWRPISSREAFYDESRWAAAEGIVVRIRRKAFLVWQQGERVL
jgi:hypothetical protein